MRIFNASVILLYICIHPTSAFSQDTLWTRLYGGPNLDAGNSVQQTTDRGFIILGSADNFEQPWNELWLIKTDSNGDEEWNRTFGGRNSDYGDQVLLADDGGYNLVGTTSSFGAGNSDTWLIKTDSLGIEEWSQTYGGTRLETGASIAKTNDGGYIITGFTGSYGAGDWDVWLVKTDSEGNEEWTRTFGGELLDEGLCVRQTSDGGYIVTGLTESFGAGMYDLWLIKTDSNGEEEWNRTFGGLQVDRGESVFQRNDGGYVILGMTMSFRDNREDPDVWLIKTDSMGVEEWSKTYGDTDNEEGCVLQPTSDGGFILLAYYHSRQNGENYPWIIKTDSSGEVEWDQTYGGDGEDVGNDIQQTSDGDFVITGFTSSFDAQDRDAWLIRLDNLNNTVHESPISTPDSYSLRSVYPNPFNSMITVTVELPRTSQFKLILYNTIGQQVQVITNNIYPSGFHTISFNAADLASGIYFVRALVPGTFSESKKIVLLR